MRARCSRSARVLQPTAGELRLVSYGQQTMRCRVSQLGTYQQRFVLASNHRSGVKFLSVRGARYCHGLTVLSGAKGAATSLQRALPRAAALRKQDCAHAQELLCSVGRSVKNCYVPQACYSSVKPTRLLPDR